MKFFEIKEDLRKNNSIVDQVIEQLRLSIVNKKYKLGDKLPSEFELMEEFSVGRNSLREAMRVLTTLGVVEVKRGDGTYLCSELKPNSIDFVIYSILLEESSADEIIELRETLDKNVLNIAILKRTNEDLIILEDYINEMREHFKNKNIELAALSDYNFHIYLAKCCKNRFLERIMKGVYSLFEGSIQNNIRTEEQFADADKHHQNILNCLKNKDLSKVDDVVSDTLTSWKENIKKNLYEDFKNQSFNNS